MPAAPALPASRQKVPAMAIGTDLVVLHAADSEMSSDEEIDGDHEGFSVGLGGLDFSGNGEWSWIDIEWGVGGPNLVEADFFVNGTLVATRTVPMIGADGRRTFERIYVLRTFNEGDGNTVRIAPTPATEPILVRSLAVGFHQGGF